MTDKIIGSSGQFLQYDNTNVLVATPLINPIVVVSNANALEAAKGAGEDFKRVFDTYQRVSIHSSVPESDTALPKELTTWKLISGRIQCTLNTGGFVGFVSPESQEDYTFTVNLFSAGSDDDWIGLILGHYKDESGLLHALSYSRHKQGADAGGHLNYNLVGARAIRLVDRRRTPVENGGWSTALAGCRVRVTRVGDIITCESTTCYKTTAQRDAAAYDPSYKIVYDLKSSEQGRRFLGPQRYGYMAYSQDTATYEVLSKPGGSAPIYDITNQETWVKEPEGWVVSPSNVVFKHGQFYSDTVNKRLFTYEGIGLEELF